MHRRSIFLAILSVCGLQAATIYNTIPGLLPPNMTSLGYQANQTAEFGGLIQFAGTQRDLTTVTVVMSDWALASTYGSTDANWNHQLTLNLYNVDDSGANPAVGTLIGSRTQAFDIPWRPEASAGCGTAWRAGDNNCYNGLAFTVDFDVLGITVPDRIVYGIAFNTNTWGYSPLGQSGPYESLNFALSTVDPLVGSNPQSGTAFWNTMTPANYTDGGAAGFGVFRRDTNWEPYSGAISFDATGVPEPATYVLFGAGLLAIAVSRKMK